MDVPLFSLSKQIAELGPDLEAAILKVLRSGQYIGGKETQAVIPSVMAALVASKTKRPARVAYSKDDDMQSTGKRHPYKIHYKAAFTRKGVITGLKFDIFSNGGAGADLSNAVMDRTLFHSENAYFIPNLIFNGRVCKSGAVSKFSKPFSTGKFVSILETSEISSSVAFTKVFGGETLCSSISLPLLIT